MLGLGTNFSRCVVTVENVWFFLATTADGKLCIFCRFMQNYKVYAHGTKKLKSIRISTYSFRNSSPWLVFKQSLRKSVLSISHITSNSLSINMKNNSARIMVYRLRHDKSYWIVFWAKHPSFGW